VPYLHSLKPLLWSGHVHPGYDKPLKDKHEKLCTAAISMIPERYKGVKRD